MSRVFIHHVAKRPLMNLTNKQTKKPKNFNKMQNRQIEQLSTQFS